MSERLSHALSRLDAIHMEDPECDASGRANELVYAEAMTRWLTRLAPDASEALQVAVRAQHLGRFRTPRASFPDGRVGYLKWRREQGQMHARLAAETLREAGWDEASLERVAALISKERLKDVSDVEAQTLEDCACLVFLDIGIDAFLVKEGDESVISILQKTWKKMSPRAHALARFFQAAARAVQQELAGQAAAHIDQHGPDCEPAEDGVEVHTGMYQHQ